MDPPEPASCGIDYTVTDGQEIQNQCPNLADVTGWKCWAHALPKNYSGTFSIQVNIIGDTENEGQEAVCFRLKVPYLSLAVKLDENNDSHALLINDNISGIYSKNGFKENSVYPNPTADILFLKNTLKSDCWVICDFLGRNIIKGSGSIIDLSLVPSGAYFLKITHADIVSTHKIVKQ